MSQKKNSGAPRGRLRLTVREPDGALAAERQVRNIVLRRGAEIIAGLFSGAAGSGPIDRVQVGFADQGATPDLTALTPPEEAVPAAALRSAIGPESFKITAGRPGSVQVSIEATFHPTVDLKGVTEAGLLAGDRLYNQVVFEPVDLRVGQDVTFFWEVDFPFGH
jgi:hypothetical protein